MDGRQVRKDTLTHTTKRMEEESHSRGDVLREGGEGEGGGERKQKHAMVSGRKNALADQLAMRRRVGHHDVTMRPRHSFSLNLSSPVLHPAPCTLPSQLFSPQWEGEQQRRKEGVC